jgi:hypothetical protein
VKIKTKIKYTIIGPIAHDEQFYTCYEHKHIFEIYCIFERCGIDGDYGRGKPLYVIYTYMDYFLDVIYEYFLTC